MSRKHATPGRHLAIGLFALLCASLATRHAEANDLIVESYVGPRPADAGELLGPVLEALEKQRFAAPFASAAAVDAKVSAPSELLSEADIASATKFIESAFAQFQSGSFKNTLRDATPGLATLRGGLATLIRLPKVRETRLRGLVALALAHGRLGNKEEAEQAAAEIVRSFSDKPIDTAVYSPEVVELMAAAKTSITRKGTATLTVEVDNPGTEIFINEIFAGSNRVEKRELPPGEYRVVLQNGDQLGRVHRVRLAGGERRVLPLSWTLDEALATDGNRVVLRFADEATRASREGEFALALAREVGAKRVAVLGVRAIDGKRGIIGTLYAATRKTPDGAWLALEPTPPQTDALTALGNYLGGDKSGANLIEQLDPRKLSSGTPPPAATRPPPGDDSSSSALGWVTVGAGVLAMGAGATLFVIHEDEFNDAGERNPNPRNTRVAGIVTASAGALLTGLGVVLLLRDGGSSSKERTAISVAPTDGGFAVGLFGSF